MVLVVVVGMGVVVIDEILVRLDLRDAVRTSALSHAWRDLWKSLSVLSLSFPLGTHPSVVDSVLLRYIGPRVSLFDIYVDDASAGRVDDWLLALSCCRVESIHMRCRLRSVYYFNLHSSIFSFADLASLRLQRCNIPSLPIGFAGFPALQELDLKFVHFLAHGENQLEAIIRRSPLLHALYMSNVFIPLGCPHSVIEAPNLRSLTIYSHDDYDWRIGELPCLEDANIQVDILPTVDDVEMPYTLPFTFYNLKNLKLYLDFTQMQHILFMFTLLRSCHNLEKLEIELILSKARLLRTLYVDKCPDHFDDPLVDLLKCRRASAQARVLFEGLVQQY
ncbi:unnamed protein product [Miscanthus lutarioriparius]|uniref:FBD domain-containing protein n=1 Tax=Miscanthus lutarioriparius TaxID=422564 RepID=A0A811RV17_9POAL|nr:unnamed protein product [Miscanthus lutarioriparius]